MWNVLAHKTTDLSWYGQSLPDPEATMEVWKRGSNHCSSEEGEV